MQLVRLALCVSLCLMGTSATTGPAWTVETGLLNTMTVTFKIVDQQGNDMDLCAAATTDCGKMAAFISGTVRGAEIGSVGPGGTVFVMSMAANGYEGGEVITFQAYNRADATLYDLSPVAQTVPDTSGATPTTKTFTAGENITFTADAIWGSAFSPVVLTAVAQPTSTPTSMPTSTPTTFTQPTPTSAPTSTPTTFTQPTPTSMPTFTPTTFTQPTPTFAPTLTPTTYTQPTPTSMPTFTPTTYTPPTPTSMPTSFGLPPTPTSGTTPTYTCAAIQAAYKAQQCCINPSGYFTLPGNRRQVSDRHTDLIEKFAMLDTLVKKGHISAQEYSIYKEKLLETLM